MLKRKRAWLIKYTDFLLGIVGLVFLGIAWELFAKFELMNPLLISSPSKIFVAGIRLFSNGDLIVHLQTSLYEMVVGYLLAVIIGIPLGIIMGWYQTVEYSLDPFVWFLYSAPLIAFYPLFIVWLGLGIPTVIALTLLLTVFPIIVNTITGVKNVNPILLRSARAFGASDFVLFLRVVIPSALPIIIAGLRLGAGRAMIGVIIGEFFGATKGIGYFISYSGARLRMDELFFGLFLTVIIGVSLTQGLKFMETKISRWRTE